MVLLNSHMDPITYQDDLGFLPLHLACQFASNSPSTKNSNTATIQALSRAYHIRFNMGDALNDSESNAEHQYLGLDANLSTAWHGSHLVVTIQRTNFWINSTSRRLGSQYLLPYHKGIYHTKKAFNYNHIAFRPLPNVHPLLTNYFSSTTKLYNYESIVQQHFFNHLQKCPLWLDFCPGCHICFGCIPWILKWRTQSFRVPDIWHVCFLAPMRLESTEKKTLVGVHSFENPHSYEAS